MHLGQPYLRMYSSGVNEFNMDCGRKSSSTFPSLAIQNGRSIPDDGSTWASFWPWEAGHVFGCAPWELKTRRSAGTLRMILISSKIEEFVGLFCIKNAHHSLTVYNTPCGNHDHHPRIWLQTGVCLQTKCMSDDIHLRLKASDLRPDFRLMYSRTSLH